MDRRSKLNFVSTFDVCLAQIVFLLGIIVKTSELLHEIQSFFFCQPELLIFGGSFYLVPLKIVQQLLAVYIHLFVVSIKICSCSNCSYHRPFENTNKFLVLLQNLTQIYRLTYLKYPNISSILILHIRLKYQRNIFALFIRTCH